MDYDFRNRAAASSPYDPPYRASASTSYGQTMYPRVGQGQAQAQAHPHPFGGRHPSFHHQTPAPSSSSSSSSSGIGIRVTLKPEYRITPPPQMSPLVRDIPRSNFQFDFDFERKILAEAEKENPNWSRLVGSDNPLPLPGAAESHSSSAPAVDPLVSKYVASGLNREAVPLAVANYGDNPTKVREFANAFTLLREMGFPPNNVGEALLMFDNDTDKALAHFLNTSA